MSSPDKVGKYRITGVIGEGVSGVVYKAFDPSLQRVVAVKSLQRELPADSRGAQAFAARLREQGQAITRLAHPGVVAVHEIDEFEGRAFIAMEHVAGLNLAQWLAVTPLPAQSVLLQVMDQLLDALECAHLSGVRHGDLKPSNVLITGTGFVKITDFGLARAEGRPVALVGVAPEYQSGRLIDHRVDVYGAGAILYRMLVGRDPFAEAADSSTLGAMLRPPSMVAEAQRPAYFDSVVAKALAHDPNQRFANAAEFRQALRDANEQRTPDLGGTVVTLASSGRGAVSSSDVPVIGDTPVPPDAMTARSSSSRDAPTGEAAASLPTLTIAIPDSVLAMPTYDPWAGRTRGRKAVPRKDEQRRDGALASDAAPPSDEAYAAFRDQVDRDRRSTVVSAAAAATAALSAAADTAEAARDVALSREPVREPVRARAPSPRRSDAGPSTISGLLSLSGSAKAPRSKIDLSMPIGSIAPALRVKTPVAAPAADVPAPAAGEEIPAEALRRVLKVLSAHLGPVAGDVLKHVAGRARSIPELHKLLLEQAGDGVDKKRMAKQLKAVAKMPL